MSLGRAARGLVPVLAGGCLVLLLVGCGGRDPVFLRERGARLYRAGRYDLALRDFRRAVERDPQNGEGRLWLAMALWRKGETEESLRAFYEAAALLPHDPRPFEYAARVLGAAGRWREARVMLNQAMQRASVDSPPLLNAMGVASAMDGKIEAARAQFEACGPYPPALYNGAVLARDVLRDRKLARRLFEAYLKQAPDGERSDAARRALELLEGEVTDSSSVSRSGPASGFPRAEGAELMKQARAALQRRAFEEAALRFREAADADPRNADAVWEMAQVWDKRLSNPDHAIESYRRFLRDFSDDARAVEARRRLNELSLRPPPPRPLPETPPEPLVASELSFRKPEKRQPDAARAALLRGNQYLMRSDYDRAIFDFRRAIELDDTLNEAYFNLGLAYWHQKKDPLARALFQRALAARPDWAEARYMLALVYQREGLWIKAEEHFRELIRTRPDFADAHAALAQHYQNSPAHRSQTRAWYEQYLKLAPNGRYAAAARAWLDAHP